MSHAILLRAAAILFSMVAGANAAAPPRSGMPPEAFVREDLPEARLSELEELGRARARLDATEIVDTAYEIRFDEDLLERRDATLRGLSSKYTVNFTHPRSWELTADPVVHVRFAHNEKLLTPKSTLTVILNDEPIRTIGLTPENAELGEADVALPRKLIQKYNRLGFFVNQHVTDDCEDPFDPGLWSVLQMSSSITMAYRPLRVVPELLDFPFPIQDDRGYGPVRVAMAGSAELSGPSLEAAGQVALVLGRYADYRRVAFQPNVASVRDATTATLVVGTPTENPEIRRLVDTSRLVGDQGLVALLANEARPDLPVLVVTGATPAGVLAAAYGLARQDASGALSGGSAIIGEEPSGAAPESRRMPRVVPESGSFTLDDLGVRDATVVGYYAPAIRVGLAYEGDAKVWPSAGRILVHYGYSAGLETKLSTMEIRVNNITVRSVGLTKEEGEQAGFLKVNLPTSVLTPGSELQVVFNLFPVEHGRCKRVMEDQLWGTLYADSVISLPRDHTALLPDLSLFRYRAWPFTSERADESTDVVLSDRPTGLEVSSGLQILSDLGRLSAARYPRMKLVTSSGVAGEGYKVLLATRDAPHELYRSLDAEHSLVVRALEEDGARLNPRNAFSVAVEAGYPTVEQVQPSGRAGTAALILRAPDGTELLRLAKLLTDDRFVQELDGNAAVVLDGDVVQTVSTKDPVRVSRLTMAGRVRLAVQENAAYLSVLMLPGALVGAALLGRWARRRGGTTQ